MNWLKRHLFKITTFIFLLTTGSCLWIILQPIQTGNQISLPLFSYTDLSEYGYEYVTVNGTLVSDIPGNDVANPLNTNKFTCDKSIGQCEMIQAEIFNDSILNLYEETFLISSWDSNYITFESLPTNQSCVVWKYRIDRFKQELVGVREKSMSNTESDCMGIGIDKFAVKIVDGWDVVSKLRGYKSE